MPNFRTSSLFHYTSYYTLKKILKEGLMPNYCKEDFSYIDKDKGKESIIGVPMVSFCDIPLMRTQEFTQRYGRHAIGLSKKWALEKKINPVFYIDTDDIISSFKFYQSYEYLLKKELEKIGSDGFSLDINIRDSESVSKLVPLINHVQSHNANVHLYGFAKKYEGIDKSGKIQCNYEENEWRYIVKDNGRTIKWKMCEKEYDDWRGKDKKKPYSPELERYKLTFDVKDITYIVVDLENQIMKIVDEIDELSSIGGSMRALTSNDKKILYSKIISMDKIKRDF